MNLLSKLRAYFQKTFKDSTNSEIDKTDCLSDFKEKRKEIRDEELGEDYISEKINELAQKLLEDKKEEVDQEAEIIGQKLKLDEMKRAVDIYLHNAVDMYPEPINFKRRGVVIRYCVAFGESICDYIDKIAFGEYDWTQYEAIDLLCRMALIKDIRKKTTLELIDENIDNFRYTSLMNSLQSMQYFKDEPIVQKIYERQLDKAKDDYQEFINILEMYYYSNQNRFEQYLPHLKKIIIESGDGDYSVLAMSHIMKSKNGGEMIAYNEDGSIFDEEEGIEAIKLQAGIMYYLTDKTDNEVNNYLKYIKSHSKFDNHKEYLANSIEL